MNYKLRNMPESIHKLLKKKQKQLNEETGRFHSLEQVIYIILKQNCRDT